MWYYNSSKDGIVISSRVRFARNLEEYNFPNMLDTDKSEKIIEKLNGAIDNAKLLKLEDIDNITLNSLVERHLISKEFIAKRNKKAVILNDECTLSIMVNEEDYLRIQGFSEGEDITKAYNIAKEAEESIGKKLKYAESEKYGYLTACPTNVGSGLRVSCMIHLPALTKLGYISKLIQDIATFGLTIRGLYGENTYASGCIYQISNQKTMGYSDDEIINNVEKIVKNIVKQEKKARNVLMEDKVLFEDNIMRSLGVLKYARRIDTKEAEKHLSNVRLGISTSIIQDIDINTLQKVSVNIFPNMLQLECKQSLDEEKRDVERANYIRKELN